MPVRRTISSLPLLHEEEEEGGGGGGAAAVLCHEYGDDRPHASPGCAEPCRMPQERSKSSITLLRLVVLICRNVGSIRGTPLSDAIRRGIDWAWWYHIPVQLAAYQDSPVHYMSIHVCPG